MFISAGEMRKGLCEPCRAALSLSQGQRCNLCSKPLISEKEICLLCRNAEKKPYDRLWTLFPYTGKYRNLLTAYKFGKNLALAEFFAGIVSEIIEGNPVLKDAAIVPVPPRPGKIKSQGWDQVEYLVKRLEKLQAGHNIYRCLKREKSQVQKRLDRAGRAENLKGRILLNSPPPQTALIIDDVITTGSTMDVCSAALKAGGAERVYGLCLFYD